MKATRVFLVLVLLAACGDNDDAASTQRMDPSLLTNSSGEVDLTDGGSLSYVITSERYKKWDAAQRGLSRTVAARFGQILNPRSPSERSINQAVAYLEGQPAARAAIQRAGMSVRDFVVMTVALEQQMQLAASRGEAPPVYAPDATMDSGYLPVPPPTNPYPQPYPQYPYPQPVPQYPPTYPPAYPPPATPATPTPYPAPAPVPTPTPTPTPRRDTTRVDSIPRPAPPPRDTVPRRDTLPSRRDTIVLPPRSDTGAVAPPDSTTTP